ncbi:MAG: SDR family NAD(P)-dependent oxidoreductase [Holophaga sp.]|nr:SDR family NAD(P)-dependent oxidoreductase [Holophaga sp.]
MTTTIPGLVLITGANGGLGSRLVEGLLESGVTNIACHYRSSTNVITKLLEAHGLPAERHLFQAELTDEAEVQAMGQAIADRLGPVWGLVNIAGRSSNSMSWKLSTQEFINIVHANLLSTFLVTREFLPGMREKEGGRIINVSSVIAHTGIAGASHYCAAKAGIEGFTKAVAQEVASKNITVNCLSLGYFNKGIISDVPTAMLDVIKSRVPLKRLGKAEELFPLVNYLLGQGSAFMTGQILHLNGGLY